MLSESRLSRLYNEHWKENIKLFKVTERSEATEGSPPGRMPVIQADFIAELAQHIPPKLEAF